LAGKTLKGNAGLACVFLLAAAQLPTVKDPLQRVAKGTCSSRVGSSLEHLVVPYKRHTSDMALCNNNGSPFQWKKSCKKYAGAFVYSVQRNQEKLYNNNKKQFLRDFAMSFAFVIGI
jgi:hypothetical protein